MKKLLFVFAVAAFTACGGDTKTESTMDSATEAKKDMIDSSANAKMEKIDSSADAQKAMLDSAANKAADTSKAGNDTKKAEKH